MCHDEYRLCALFFHLGDLTEQGYTRNKAQLESKYLSSKSPPRPSISAPSTSAITEELANPSSRTQSSLIWSGAKTNYIQFTPSGITSASLSKKTKHRKPNGRKVTVLVLSNSVLTRRARNILISKQKVRDRP